MRVCAVVLVVWLAAEREAPSEMNSRPLIYRFAGKDYIIMAGAVEIARCSPRFEREPRVYHIPLRSDVSIQDNHDAWRFLYGKKEGREILKGSLPFPRIEGRTRAVCYLFVIHLPVN